MTKDEFIKKWCPCTASGNDDDCRAHHLRPDVEALIAAEVRRLGGTFSGDCCRGDFSDGMVTHSNECAGTPRGPELDAETAGVPLESTLTVEAFREALLAKHGEEGLREKLQLASSVLRGPELDAETKREGE